MNIVNEIAGYAGGAICGVSAVVYLWAIATGRVHSNKVTWGIWTLVTAMLCVSYYQSVGLVSSIWTSVAYFVSTAAAFVFLMFYAKKGEWTWVERFALVSAIITLILWVIFRAPLMAMTLTLAIDIFGAIPLAVTVYRNAKSEYAPAWLLGFLANTINLLAIEHWDYANAAYPVYMVILTGTVSFLAIRKNR